MVVLKLNFPAGRYHATPWGRHVNEGAVEWPPSPWRLLRALVATWHLKAPELPPATVQALLETLASELPRFHLPPASTGHTRHYMPYNEGKKSNTTKIFDTFVQTSPEHSVYVVWDTPLPPEQTDALATLASRLGYLGRAESLVAAQRIDEVPEVAKKHLLSRPLLDKAKEAGEELVRLLCAQPSAEYANWRKDFLSQSKSSPDQAGKKGKKGKAQKLPETLFDALHADTAALQKEGWNLPPGALYQNYARPENALAPPPFVRSPRKKTTKLTVARYEVVSNVLPRLTKTISVADRIHQTLCSKSDTGQGSLSVFSGLDSEGKPLRGHQHAHIFCEPGPKRDSIQYITIYAPIGFNEAAQTALRLLSKTWGKGGHDLRYVLHGIGEIKDFKDTPLFRSSKRFRSLTPYFSTRHAKTYSDGRPKLDSDGWPIGSARQDLKRLLELRNNLPPVQIGKPSNYVTLPNGRHVSNLQFQTTRSGKQSAPNPAEAAAVELIFSEAIQGPLALGYGTHFGLGVFVPVTES